MSAKRGKSSNKSRGDAFRDRIFDLCIAAGYKPIKEYKLRGKAMDCIFEIERLPIAAKIAIEAKFYSQNLSKKLSMKLLDPIKRLLSVEM